MPRLATGNVEGKGRCVFTLDPIAKGAVIDFNQVILLDRDYVDQCGAPLSDYPLAWDDKHHALVLGSISLVNHANEPNAFIEREPTHLLLRLVALRDIEPGEEIAYDYKVPLWFEPKPCARLTLEK